MRSSIADRVSAVVYGVFAGFATVVVFEVVAFILAPIAKWHFSVTGWVHLGSEWSAWLGVVVVYWAFLPAVFSLIVGARGCKARWNG